MLVTESPPTECNNSVRDKLAITGISPFTSKNQNRQYPKATTSFMDSDVPRRSTVHRVLEAGKEEPGPAASALPPITDSNVMALIQQMQIQNQSLIAAMMAQPILSPVIHKPALPPICTGPAGEVDLQRFETHMTTYELPRKRWPAELHTLLRDDLLNTAMAMSADAAANYEQLKTLLLAHMGISTADGMASWLEQRTDSNDTMMQAALRMQEVSRVCTRQCKTVDDVTQMVSLELLYKTMKPRLATYIRSQNPTTLTEMARALDNYVSSMQKPKSYMWKLE